jgi:predicted glycosyltransferase
VTAAARWRCLFWVQSLLGSGHLRRTLLLAEAFAARGGEVTLVNGGPAGPWQPAAGVRLVQLPPVLARGGDFGDLVDGTGAPYGDRLRTERQRTLLNLLTMQPQAVATEMFPFGRRAFRAELLPWLEAASSLRPRPCVVASVRDILVSKPDPARYRWMVDACLAHYDRVLVHGDERLMPFAASFPPAAELGARVVQTGFVHQGVPPSIAGPAPAVLVSAGGGAVGERLLRATLSARPRSRYADAPWLLVGGHNLPAPTLAALAAELPPGCALVRHRPDLAALMGRCEVAVSQAGYNTVVEALAVGARMVLVPFAAGEEDEQERRARRLVALGLAERVGEAEVDGELLAAAIDRVAGRPRPNPAAWSFDGAGLSAEIVARLVRERSDAR